MQWAYGVTHPIYRERIIAVFERPRDATMLASSLHDHEENDGPDRVIAIPYIEDVDRIKAEWKPCSVESACDHVDDIERPIFG